MENNLYYPPTIEEFYVGFEYEIKIKDNWRKKSTTISDFSPISDYDGMSILEEDLISNIIRVKTLDQSDIESLGWRFKTKGPFRTWYTGSDSWFNNTIPTGDSGRYWSFELSHDIKYNGIIIKAGTNYGDTDTFFEGTIKNKSELIKLMQQLNIK